MKNGKMLFNTALISAFSFACKGLGMLFRLYLTARVGAGGIGLYQLIMSVYALFASFASAGYSVTVSRLAAEDLERGGGKNASYATTKLAMRMAVLSGTCSALLLLITSFPVASVIAGEGKTLVPLRVLAFSLPFISLSSCLKGYFMASRKAAIPASAQLFEELCKTGMTVAVLSVFMSKTTDEGALCAGIALGLVAGEILSFAYLRVFFAFSRRGENKVKAQLKNAGRISSVLFPVAAANWLTGGLHAAENVLIPYCFALYSSAGSALEEFGVIRGMAIPVLFFPFAFVSAFISILTPEISRLNVADASARDAAVGRVLRMTSLISTAAGAFMLFYSSEISACFYRTQSAAHAIRMLAFVTPFMYIETVSDGILKSIGEQKYCMRVTLANCIVRVAAVFLLIPRTGAEGYIRLLMISNSFSCFMCAGKLIKKCRVRGVFTHFIYPAAASAAAGFAAAPFCASFGDTARLCAGGCIMLFVFALLCLPVILKNGDRKLV